MGAVVRVVLLLAVGCLLPLSRAWPCTIFAFESKGGLVVGANEDGASVTRLEKVVEGSMAGRFGGVYLAVNGSVESGMNEHGLFFDWNALPGSPVRYNPGKPPLSRNAPLEFMRTSRTVEEAIAYLRRFSVEASGKSHLFLADPSGRSVVVEWIEDKMNVIERQEKWLVASNFHMSTDVAEKWGVDRYEQAEKGLRNLKDESTESFSAVLDSVHQEVWGDTVYSGIFDLKNRKITEYLFHDFRNPVVVDVMAQIAMGDRRSPLEAHFASPSLAYRQTLKKEISRQHSPLEQLSPIRKGLGFLLPTVAAVLMLAEIWRGTGRRRKRLTSAEKFGSGLSCFTYLTFFAFCAALAAYPFVLSNGMPALHMMNAGEKALALLPSLWMALALVQLGLLLVRGKKSHAAPHPQWMHVAFVGFAVVFLESLSLVVLPF